MANELGHIFAPVGIKEVADTLNESDYDVAKLCMSENINPYSLIRPTPTQTPDMEVSRIKYANAGAAQSGTWERKLWNYQVPYVTSPYQLDSIKDISWYRPTPSDSDFKSLNHFDGYLHDAKPQLFWGVPNDTKAGDKIRVLLGFGDIQTDIISDTGNANNGGVVSVMEVFGDSVFYYGVIIKYNNFTHWYFGDAVDPKSGNYVGGIIETDLTAIAGTTYEITPFLCNKGPSGTNLPNNAHYYSLKFAPNFQSTQSIHIDEETIALSVRASKVSSLGVIEELTIALINTTHFKYSTSLIELQGTEFGTTSVYPRSIYYALDKTIEVDAYKSTNYIWERRIPFYGAASTNIMFTLNCTVRSSNGGAAKVLTSNQVIAIRKRIDDDVAPLPNGGTILQ